MKRVEYCKILDELNAVKLYTEDEYTEEQISNISGVSKGSVHTYLSIIKGIKTRKAARRKSLRNIYPIGTKFGQWTIISEDVKIGSDRKLCQLCQCCCGEIQWKQLSSLRNGTSTKCKKCGNKTFIDKNGNILISGLILSYFKHIKNNLEKRKKVSQLEFNITPEYLEKLYEDQNHRCALSNLSLEIDKSKRAIDQNWSLDRIDSNKGYIEGNVQWVDKRINMMKQSFNQDEFIKMCIEVAKNNGYTHCS